MPNLPSYVPLVADRVEPDGSELYIKSIGKLRPTRRDLLLLDAGENGIVQRYRNEAKLLEQSKHEHIIALKEFRDAETDKNIHLEVELARLGNMQRFGTSATKSSLIHRLEQTAQIVDAPAYLHEQMGIVHGSLDLGHVLVFSREGDDTWASGLVKLCGLGSATRIGKVGQPRPALDYRPPESFTEVSGTKLGYRSYRQLRMEGSWDVYAVGRMLLQWVLKVKLEKELVGRKGEEYEVKMKEYVIGIRNGRMIEGATERLPEWWRERFYSVARLRRGIGLGFRS